MADLSALKDRIDQSNRVLALGRGQAARSEDAVMADPTKYRVTMLCPCQVDWVEGYGPTPEAARAKADEFWNKNHRGETPTQIVLEHAVDHGGGGSHYEEVG